MGTNTTKEIEAESKNEGDDADEDDEAFWDEEVTNAVLALEKNQRKMDLALEKIKILEGAEEIPEPSDASCKRRRKVRKKRRRRKSCGKRKLSPFIRFYLTVYKELCGKCPIQLIAKEAARRWRYMTLDEKAKYNK